MAFLSCHQINSALQRSPRQTSSPPPASPTLRASTSPPCPPHSPTHSPACSLRPPPRAAAAPRSSRRRAPVRARPLPTRSPQKSSARRTSSFSKLPRVACDGLGGALLFEHYSNTAETIFIAEEPPSAAWLLHRLVKDPSWTACRICLALFLF